MTTQTARKHTPAEYVSLAKELPKYTEGVKEAAHAIKYGTAQDDMVTSRAHSAADSCEEIIRRRDGDTFTLWAENAPYINAIETAMLQDAEAKAAKTKTPTIKRADDPNMIAYTDTDERDDDTLGHIRLTASADHVPGVRRCHSCREPQYTVTLYVDDLLTINGRSYSRVQATCKAYGNADFGKAWATTGRYDDKLTDIARAVIGQAAEPIIRQYINDQGGAEALKKNERNRARRREAGYYQQEAERAHEQAARVLATIEA